MSKIIDLKDRRPPVVYTVRVVHHWDDTLEFHIEDVADDSRSRVSVIDALQRISGLQEPADALHGYLLQMIDGLMSAEAGTEEAERLREIAEIVQAYEEQRFPNVAG